MAGTSLLALIDDIAALLDDVAVMTKVATKKTAGVLGDDLALNAQQVTGVVSDRELPVVWAVAKGSAKNKVILVPAAMLISAFANWLITPLLMIGGAFLCFEGFEKVAHKILHKSEHDAEAADLHEAFANPEVDMVEFEKEKISGAIRTDFILSAEIIVIALGTMGEATLQLQAAALVTVAVLMTVGVYGLVAGIVKLDDFGLHLVNKGGSGVPLGKALLVGTPWLMKGLGFFGTIAMFLVGGGILAHGLPVVKDWAHHVEAMEGVGGLFATMGLQFVTGVICGGIIVAVYEGIRKVLPKKEEPQSSNEEE